MSYKIENHTLIFTNISSDEIKEAILNININELSIAEHSPLKSYSPIKRSSIEEILDQMSPCLHSVKKIDI